MRRWLWLLAGILILSACSRDKNLIETPVLQAYTPQAITGFAAPLRPAIINTPTNPDFPGLILESLTCTENITQGLACLGWVNNPLAVAYQNVTVEIQLLDEANQIIETQTGTIARDWLPADSGAPFRILFASTPDTPVTPIGTLTTADPVRESLTLTALSTENIQTEQVAGTVTVSGEVLNPTEQRIEPVSIVITARDSSGTVLGFRVLAVEQLTSQARTAFLTTLGVSSTVTLEVTADGYLR